MSCRIELFDTRRMRRSHDRKRPDLRQIAVEVAQDAARPQLDLNRRPHLKLTHSDHEVAGRESKVSSVGRGILLLLNQPARSRIAQEKSAADFVNLDRRPFEYA